MRYTRHLFDVLSQVIAFRDSVKNAIGCQQRLVFVPLRTHPQRCDCGR